MLQSLSTTLIGNARLYDWVQELAGYRQCAEFLMPHLAESAGSRLIDIGAGTGNYQRFVPPSTRYIWLDSDPQKLVGYRRKIANSNGRASAILADGAHPCLRPRSIEYALCSCVAHHLDDKQLDAMLADFSQVLRKRLILFDPIWRPDRWKSRLLWSIDRGSYPRTVPAIRAAMERHFSLQLVEELTVHHQYAVFIGEPRTQMA
jgi:ubiquinone/menaquinone biosynthesis C-methylase UbiE